MSARSRTQGSSAGLRRGWRAVALAAATLLVIVPHAGSAAAAEDPLAGPQGTAVVQQKVGGEVLDALRRGEDPAVIVALNTGFTSTPHGRRLAVAVAQAAALMNISDGEFEVRHRYANVPAIAAIARSESAIRRLAANPAVRRIDLDLDGTGALAQSVPLIRADLRHLRGNTGGGVVVAVLDSGVDSGHAGLTSAPVAEACFGDNNGSIDGTGFCPNGSDRQTGPGAAADDAGHGTHVTGIVAASGTVGGSGVAPDVGFVSVKVLNNCSFAGCFSSLGEIVAALDYIIDNPQLGVRIINMSLGTNALFNGACDSAGATAMAAANAVNTLRANGVITFASAGNNGSPWQMPLPACLSNVVSVGAVDTTTTWPDSRTATRRRTSSRPGSVPCRFFAAEEPYRPVARAWLLPTRQGAPHCCFRPATRAHPTRSRPA
jgi:subtilisin family serine protease